MGIMAFNTIPFRGNLMAAFGLGRNDLFMTLETDLICAFGQELTVRRGVGIMAIGAIS